MTDRNGGVYAASTTGDFSVVSYDAIDGDQLWATSFDGPAGRLDQALALSVGPGQDGADRVYVAGVSAGAGTEEDYAVGAFSGPDGELLWADRYDGPGHGWDEPASIVVDGTGERVFVTGVVQGTPGPFEPSKWDYGTLAYDSGINDTPNERHGGEYLWKALYDGIGHGTDRAYALAVGADGKHVYVTGGSSQVADDVVSCTDCDYVTLAYRVSDGEETWVARYGGPGLFDNARSVALSPNGERLFVTGESQEVNNDFVTVAYDAATGTELWDERLRTPDPASIDVPYTVATSSSGNEVYVSGQSAVPFGVGLPPSWFQADAVTVSYDAASGTQRWVARHNTSDIGIDSYWSRFGSWTALAVSPKSQGVFVARTFLRGVDKFLGAPNPEDFGVTRYEP